MVPVPTGMCANYARTVSAALPSLQNAAVWLRVPLVCDDTEASPADAKTVHEVRSLCCALIQRPAGLVDLGGCPGEHGKHGLPGPRRHPRGLQVVEATEKCSPS